MEKLTINELSKRCGVWNGVLRNWSLKINYGDTFTENYCNVNYVKTKLIERLGSKKAVDEKLGFNLDELEIVKGERISANDYIELDDLIENEDYAIRHYHNEVDVTFIKMIELEDNECYVFRDVNDKYKVYKASDFDSEKLNIKIK